MTDLEQARAVEREKYTKAYQLPHYRMGHARKRDAHSDLQWIKSQYADHLDLAYIDVGCGRGEMLDFAKELGFARVAGCEVVPELVEAHENACFGRVDALPFEDGAFNVASMLDVIEHLLPGDDELACAELNRVATDYILITASNRPSNLPSGEDLHINKRPYDEWDALFKAWFSDAEDVLWVKGALRNKIGETWLIQKLP